MLVGRGLMFFFKEDETAQEVFFRLKHGGVLLASFIGLPLLALCSSLLIQTIPPLFIIFVELLLLLFFMIFWIEITSLMRRVQKMKKKSKTQSSGSFISLSNPWTITLQKEDKQH